MSNNKKITDFNTYEELIDAILNDENFRQTLKAMILENITEYKENLKTHPSKEPFLHVDTYKKDTNVNIDFENYVLMCKVKDILSELRLQQKWLAEKTNIPQSSLSGIINNAMPVSLEYAMRICKVLGLTMEQAFDYVDLSPDNKK